MTDVSWPDAFVRDYVEAGLWRGETLGGLPDRWADAYGERIAISDDRAVFGYRALADRIARMAGGFAARGLGIGDRVVMQLPNTVDFVIVFFALLRIGAQPVLSLPTHRRAEVAHVAQVAGAVAYILAETDDVDHLALAADVRAAATTVRYIFVVGRSGPFESLAAIDADPVPPAWPAPTDIAFFLLSGGTTGLPKLIGRTHNDYDYNITVSARNAAFSERTVYLAVLPIAHNYALGCPGILGALSVGGRAVLSQHAWPDEAFAIIAAERVTASALVPSLAVMWLEAAPFDDHDRSSLELLQVGGARFDPVHARRIEPELGCRLQQSFGMAEGILIQTAPEDPEQVVVETQGRPISPADEVRIVDDGDNVLPPGSPGFLQARGPYTIRGYYAAPDHNRRVFTDDGFLRTGDRAVVSTGDTVTILGRADEVINRGGEKISADEIETHLLAHPAVIEAAVVGVTDEIMGERTAAFLVCRDPAPKLRDITGFFAECGLAPFKVPDQVIVLSMLPVTPMGKIDKAALRSRDRTRAGLNG